MMPRKSPSPALDPAFAASLQGRSLADLEAHPGTVYGVFADGRLGYLNPAWYRFARENDADPDTWVWQLGAPLATAIPEVLVPFYDDAFRAVRAGGEPWSQVYECSSATRLRRLRMQVLPLADGALLVVHSPLVDEPHAPGLEGVGPHDPRFRDPHTGIVVQCAHCRCVRRVDLPEHPWVFVPAYVADPPEQVSHGLCPACLAYHYPEPPPAGGLDADRESLGG